MGNAQHEESNRRRAKRLTRTTQKNSRRSHQQTTLRLIHVICIVYSSNHIQSHLHLRRKQRNQMNHSTSSSPGLLKHSCLQFLTITVLESETIVETLHHLSLNSSHLAYLTILKIGLFWQLWSEKEFNIPQRMLLCIGELNRQVHL